MLFNPDFIKINSRLLSRTYMIGRTYSAPSAVTRTYLASVPFISTEKSSIKAPSRKISSAVKCRPGYLTIGFIIIRNCYAIDFGLCTAMP